MTRPHLMPYPPPDPDRYKTGRYDADYIFSVKHDGTSQVFNYLSQLTGENREADRGYQAGVVAHAVGVHLQ
jgi:hypothetical protein